MVKSIFKRVSAVAIAGTILTGTMAVPANAKSLVTTTQKVTTTVINENFNGYEQKDHKNLKYDTLSTFPGNEDIQYKHYVGWEGAHRMEVEADTGDGRTGNILTFDNNSGIYLNFDNPSGSTEVVEGDIITIGFRYKFDTYKQQIKVNLNGNTSGRYVGKGGAYDSAVYPDGGAASYGSKNWSSTKEGRLVNLNLVNKAYTLHNDAFKDNKIATNTWYTMTITINTKDATQSNNQTIKIDNGDGTYLYGLYDANYTGEGDPTYDPFTEITSLQFTTNGCGGRTDGGTDYVSIDDVTVSVTSDREVDELVSDLSKTLVDEDFSDLSTTVKSNGWNGTPDNKKPLAGTSFQYCAYGSDGSMVGSYPTTTETEKALKISSATGHDHHYALYVDTDETALVPGDIINMSFDCYQTEANFMYVMLQGLQDKGVRYKSIRAKNWYKDDVSGQWVPVQSKAQSTKDNVATIAITGTNINDGFQNPTMLAPVFAHTGSNNAQYTFTPEKWYTIEISINTKDPAHENKQTMTLRYKERGTNTYLQEYVGYLDTDTTNDTSGDVIDALTTFNGFDIALLTLKNADTETYIDNVKAEIVKPGFEVVDVNNSTNTYTFRDTTPINLNYVTNASAASKVVIAQYAEGGRMIDATTQDVAATGRDTVTVTPVANANLIKLMILDMESAVPYAKVFKLTKSGN